MRHYDSDGIWRVYKFKRAHRGAWIADDVDLTTGLSAIGSGLNAANEDIEAVSQQVATDFDRTKAYHPGDIVRDGDNVYIFVAEHAANTDIQSSEVLETSLAQEIKKSNDQVAPEFSTATAYHQGDIVRYRGKLYVFNKDKPAGAWNPSSEYVSETSVITEMILLPDKIISYVGQKGYSKTYIQMEDPWLSKNVAEFDPDLTYQVGYATTYNNQIYIFEQIHSGAWNQNHVRAMTAADTLPIVTGDPNVTPKYTVNIGDYWIQAEANTYTGAVTWQAVKQKLWGAINELSWGLLSGYTRMFCWNGTEWIKVYDNSEIATAYTRIEQNKYEIRMEAERANAAEGQLHAEILLTADQIKLEIQQNYTTKAFFNMTADGKIQLGASNFASIGSGSSGVYLTPSKIDINSGGNLNIKSSGAMTVESGGALAIKSTNGLTIQSGASMTNSGKMTNSGTLNNVGTLNINSGGNLNIKSGGAITIESGGSLGVSSGGNLNINSSGAMNVESGGNLNIKASGNLTVKSSGTLTIDSGGKFVITSTNFKVDSSGNVEMTGKITSTSGQIGGFTIGSTSLTAGSGTSHVQVATSQWAFSAGAADPASAPFRVDRNGDVYIKSLKVRNEADTGWDTIDFTSFATDEDLKGGFDKLKYNTVKSISSDGTSMTLSNGKTYTIG